MRCRRKVVAVGRCGGQIALFIVEIFDNNCGRVARKTDGQKSAAPPEGRRQTRRAVRGLEPRFLSLEVCFFRRQRQLCVSWRKLSQNGRRIQCGSSDNGDELGLDPKSSQHPLVASFPLFRFDVICLGNKWPFVSRSSRSVSNCSSSGD